MRHKRHKAHNPSAAFDMPTAVGSVEESSGTLGRRRHINQIALLYAVSAYWGTRAAPYRHAIRAIVVCRVPFAGAPCAPGWR
ncbi:unnamed protein product, partial [Iphiclides podalirius]